MFKKKLSHVTGRMRMDKRGERRIAERKKIERRVELYVVEKGEDRAEN